ncbi:hypothetical protein TNCV_330071 [Trichonephila clavipes]|nr:hypothetical protein TNCV_330071 [Trichonephila clavipes]
MFGGSAHFREKGRRRCFSAGTPEQTKFKCLFASRHNKREGNRVRFTLSLVSGAGLSSFRALALKIYGPLGTDGSKEGLLDPSLPISGPFAPSAKWINLHCLFHNSANPKPYYHNTQQTGGRFSS